MPATCGRSGASASNLRSTRSGLPPVPFAGLVATGRLSTPDAPHAEPAHDVHHLVAARFPGIPTLADEPMPHLAASIHGGGPAGMDVHDVAGRRLVARPHAADGPWPGHAVAARCVWGPQSGASDRTLQIGPALKRFPYSSMYAAINAVSGRARPRKSRSRRRYLVRPTQFRVLRPQPLQLRHRRLRGPLRLRGGRRVRLVAPAPQ